MTLLFLNLGMYQACGQAELSIRTFKFVTNRAKPNLADLVPVKRTYLPVLQHVSASYYNDSDCFRPPKEYICFHIALLSVTEPQSSLKAGRIYSDVVL
jgi:hypothetical protein